jgi:hypothetical protein
MSAFKTDENGDFILKPVLGWEMRHIAATFLMLAVKYANNQDELEKEPGSSIPIVLTLEQALDLAETLKKEVKELQAMAANLNTTH